MVEDFDAIVVPVDDGRGQLADEDLVGRAAGHGETEGQG